MATNQPNHWPKRCYKLPPQMIEDLERVTRELGITESELVRRAIDSYLRQNHPQPAEAPGARGRPR